MTYKLLLAQSFGWTTLSDIVSKAGRQYQVGIPLFSSLSWRASCLGGG
jgi:hypothetical protein